ncbi:MAG: acylneuraminate cytidylyltransferase family protein [Magnetococcus sp. WYHC-3]
MVELSKVLGKASVYSEKGVSVMGMGMKIIGLIPARSGSKRIQGKNMALLNGKPLLQYAIESALESEMFNEIVVTSNWRECQNLALKFGVAYLSRPDEICHDHSHDFEFVSHALSQDKYLDFDIFVILRPTSPFRTAATIRRALAEFQELEGDSMRAVSLTRCHPRKSWQISGTVMHPYFADDEINGFPAYDQATQALGPVYCQNGCIHVAWTETLERYGNVSGKVIVPFLTEGYEEIDINDSMDLAFAEMLMLAQDMRGKQDG